MHASGSCPKLMDCLAPNSLYLPLGGIQNSIQNQIVLLDIGGNSH